MNEAERKTTLVRNMTEGPILRQMILFALPLMLGNLLQTVYSLADSVIVGQFVGAAGLSAVATGSEAVNLITLVGMGFAAAGQVLIGQFVGKREPEKISRVAGTLFIVLFAIATVLMFVFIFFDDWVLRAMSMPQESMEYGRSYIVTCATGAFAIAGYNAVTAILRGIGDSKRPMLFIAITSILNVILDLVFVAAFRMGAFGAALATVLSQYISFIISIIYLWRRRESVGFLVTREALRPSKRSFRLVMRLGIPQAVQMSAIMISLLFITSLINRYGVAASAANGIGMKLENITRVVCNAMGTAGCTMIAQNFGARRFDRVRAVMRDMLIVMLVSCLVIGLIIMFFPRRVFGFFTSDEGVLALGEVYAVIGLFACIGHAARTPFLQMSNGIGNALLSLIMGLMDGVVMRIGLSLLFSYVLGMELRGFWWGSCIAGYTPAIIGAIYYFFGKWEKFELR